MFVRGRLRGEGGAEGGLFWWFKEATAGDAPLPAPGPLGEFVFVAGVGCRAAVVAMSKSLKAILYCWGPLRKLEMTTPSRRELLSLLEST